MPFLGSVVWTRPPDARVRLTGAMPTKSIPVQRYPHQPQLHVMVQLAPLGDPLHVRLEPHLSSPVLHILSKAADEAVSIPQPTAPAQH